MAIPLVIGGGVWAYRAYQVYRAAQAAQGVIRAAQAAKALDVIVTAQNNAAAEAAAQEKAKTDAQAKADAAASSNCKDCDEDPDCETAREELKKAVYETKDVKNREGRGLAERLCHWLHGTDEAERARHLKDLLAAAVRVAKARDWLTGASADAPKSATNSSTMKAKDKRRIRENAEKGEKLKNCAASPETIKDSEELEELAREIHGGQPSIQPMPRADFAAACAKDALGLVNKAFGR